MLALVISFSSFGLDLNLNINIVMKALISILLILSITVCNAQEKMYKSITGIKAKTQFITDFTEKSVKIGDKQITYHTDKIERVLTIDKVEKKEWDIMGVCKWYYCTSTLKDEYFGTYYKYIIIIPYQEYPRTIDIYYFADEVTVFHNQLIII